MWLEIGMDIVIFHPGLPLDAESVTLGEPLGVPLGDNLGQRELPSQGDCVLQLIHMEIKNKTKQDKTPEPWTQFGTSGTSVA